MINVKPFSSLQDLKPFEIQPAQKHEAADFDCLTEISADIFVVENEDITLAVIWFVPKGHGRIETGCFMSAHAGKCFIPMKRAFERLLNFYPCGRLETTVKSDFNAGHRMLKILGFEREGTMKNFFDKHNYDLYARCR